MFTSIDVFALATRSIETRAQRAGINEPLDIVESAFAAFVEESPAGFETIKDAWNTFIEEGPIKSNTEKTNDMPVIHITPIAFDNTIPPIIETQAFQQLAMF